MKKHIDLGSAIVVVITFLLFFFALFTKGLTHDILLESGVLLVSIKLIIISYKNSIQVKVVENKLNEIIELLKRSE